MVSLRCWPKALILPDVVELAKKQFARFFAILNLLIG